MSERDEIRRLQSIRDQMDQSCVINFADARGAIDDALNYMRERQALADLAAERERGLRRKINRMLDIMECNDPGNACDFAKGIVE